MLKTLNGLLCADVPLRNYSHSPSQTAAEVASLVCVHFIPSANLITLHIIIQNAPIVVCVSTFASHASNSHRASLNVHCTESVQALTGDGWLCF